MPQKEPKQRELTGRHVLMILITFFGLMIAVNSVFLVKAVTSFRGEDVKGSYRQGIEYNDTLQTRARQAELGWSVRANFISDGVGEDMLIVKLSDADDLPLTGLKVLGTLHHNVDTELDYPVTFIDTGNGRLTATVNAPQGQYTLKAIAERDGKRFRFQHAISVP